MNAKVLNPNPNPNPNSKVYITDLLISPEDVSRDLLINDKDHIGGRECAIIFKPDELQVKNIRQSSGL